MRVIIILGMPCSGKSTIFKQVAKDLDLQYISSGDIARRLAKTDQTTDESLKRGGMANEELMRDEIARIISILDSDDDDMVIFDGFPRNLDQYFFMQNLIDEHDIYTMIVECSTHTIYRRNGERNRYDKGTINKRITYYLNDTRKLINELYQYDRVWIIDSDQSLDIATQEATAAVNMILCMGDDDNVEHS